MDTKTEKPKNGEGKKQATTQDIHRYTQKLMNILVAQTRSDSIVKEY